LSLPERVANRVLNELKILSPDDLQMLEKIVKARHALVVYESLQGSEARLLSIPGSQSIITILKKEDYRPRQRFSIAHELGHLELHRNKLNSISCTSKAISSFDSSQPEIELEANQFASHFLLPSRFVKSAFESHPPSFEIVREIANQFTVSLTATGSRYMQFTDEAMAFVISQRGRIKRFVASHLFTNSDLFIKVNEGVERNTMADKLLRGLAVKEAWCSVPAASWLRGDNFMRGAQVKEWSFYSQSFDMTLSLIWVDDDLYDDW
jgi:Zn-dependent peptidase ImmA (M78 family)